MDKPTKNDILQSIINDGIIKIVEFDSIESFTIICKYKYQAESKCKAINSKFGQWVYASIHDEWKNPHLSIGYRSKELSKCESCCWLDGLHSDYCKDKKYTINGYSVRFNSMWDEWQVSHDDIGANLGRFNTFKDAEEFARKG